MSTLDVPYFIRRMETRAIHAGNADRLEAIKSAVPIVVPEQYVSTSPEPVDHPGTWPPFEYSLFLSRFSTGATCGALVRVVDDFTPHDKADMCEWLASLGTPMGADGASFTDSRTTGTVWGASKCVKVLNVIGTDEFVNVFANTFWFASDRRDWSRDAYSAVGNGNWMGSGAVAWIKVSCAVALAGMDLLSCKNISMSVERETVSRPMRRRNVSGITWRTIVLSGKAAITQRGTPVNIGDLPRLHECRGHFKEYEERPLFGKHVGRFFWHPYLRGDLKRGAVIHDKYEAREK